MINLFAIEPYTINTAYYDNLLHDKVVRTFEEEFCQYVGAKYACSVNSATNAIFLCLRLRPVGTVFIPSMLPPVVANACLHGGSRLAFYDDPHWVGSSYTLHIYRDGSRFIDSAQRVDRDQFDIDGCAGDLMVFSFYPTKPVGSCDGGIIVSNDADKVAWLKTASMNGTEFSNNSWTRKVAFPGWKCYMNSIQADIALRNLRTLDERKVQLAEVRQTYNKKLGLENKSDHLYRVNVKDNDTFIARALKQGIVCGKHYEPLHRMEAYRTVGVAMPETERFAKTTVSIPFHHKLTDREMDVVISAVEGEQAYQ